VKEAAIAAFEDIQTAVNINPNTLKLLMTRLCNSLFAKAQKLHQLSCRSLTNIP
jgi:hypothetical protein